MNSLIAMCGLDCARCPAYIATRDDNDRLRRETAEAWSYQFGADLKPEDINCLGCTGGDHPRLGYCQNCQIRLCGAGRGLSTCAECPDYPCLELSDFLEHAPQARALLDEIRSRG